MIYDREHLSTDYADEETSGDWETSEIGFNGLAHRDKDMERGDGFFQLRRYPALKLNCTLG